MIYQSAERNKTPGGNEAIYHFLNHLEPLGIVLESISIKPVSAYPERYEIVVLSPLTKAQLEHLGLEEVVP